MTPEKQLVCEGACNHDEVAWFDYEIRKHGFSDVEGVYGRRRVSLAPMEILLMARKWRHTRHVWVLPHAWKCATCGTVRKFAQ